jgi:hypothetical protein
MDSIGVVRKILITLLDKALNSIPDSAIEANSVNIKFRLSPEEVFVILHDLQVGQKLDNVSRYPNLSFRGKRLGDADKTDDLASFRQLLKERITSSSDLRGRFHE